MLQGEHSAIMSTFIKLPFVIEIFVLSIFEWPLKTSLLYHQKVSGYGQEIPQPHTADLPKVSKGAKIRSRYNQVPHPTQDTNGKDTNSQLDTTNESQEVSPFPAGDHKAHINRRAQRHSKHKTEQKHKISTKEVPPWNGQ